MSRRSPHRLTSLERVLHADRQRVVAAEMEAARVGVWAHGDGSEHSVAGPLGCFPCADLRRASLGALVDAPSDDPAKIAIVKSWGAP